MTLTQVSYNSDSDSGELAALINAEIEGKRRLDEANEQARAMNERGEDGNAHYIRIKGELFAGVSTLFE